MDPSQVEHLLAERTKALANDPDRAASQVRIHAALRSERQRERGQRRERLVLMAVGLAAALLVTFFAWKSQKPTDLGRLDAQLAVLDASGRELQDAPVLRGDPATFVRPSSAILEVVATSDGFLGMFVYDAQGKLHPTSSEKARAIASNKPIAQAHDLREFQRNANGPSEVSWLVVTAKQAFTAQSLDLPSSLTLYQGPARRMELDQLAARISAELGCSASVRTTLLSLGP